MVVRGRKWLDAKEVKQSVDFRDVLRGDGVQVPSGTRPTIRCISPTHLDKTASCSVSRTGWKCYACGSSGDVFDYIKQRDNVDFQEALQIVHELGGARVCGQLHSPARHQTQPVHHHDRPTKARIDVMSRVWDLLQNAPLSTGAASWCERRGINPFVAEVIGCRDFMVKALEIGKLLKGLSEEELRASGFVNAKSKRWFPLAESLVGHTTFNGLCFPEYHADVEVPIRWRWRLFKPLHREGRKPLKAIGQYGTGLRLLPLGARLPGKEVWLRPIEHSPIVLLTEGEPDFLSSWDALQVHAAGLAVLGFPAVAYGWRDEWTSLLKDASRVVVCLHEGDATRKFTRQLFGCLQSRYEPQHARSILRVATVPEDDDLNDMHKRNDLRPWLEAMLADDIAALLAEEDPWDSVSR